MESQHYLGVMYHRGRSSSLPHCLLSLTRGSWLQGSVEGRRVRARVAASSATKDPPLSVDGTDFFILCTIFASQHKSGLSFCLRQLLLTANFSCCTLSANNVIKERLVIGSGPNGGLLLPL